MTPRADPMTAAGDGGRRDAALCGAKTRAGKRCQRPAGWGTVHPGDGSCKLHGGSTPNGRAYGARARAERQARGLLARMGQPEPVRNPTKRLLEILGEIDQFLSACRLQVEQLQDWTQVDNFGAEQAKAVIRLYVEVISMFEKALVDAARLRLEERLVVIDEATADLVLAVAERALAAAVPAEFHGPFKAAFAVEAQSREVSE